MTDEVEALTARGIALLTTPPFDPRAGIEAIVEAANRGGAQAVQLCAQMSALGAGLPQDWNAAFDCLEGAAGRGWRPAQEELRLLASRHEGTWKTLRDAVDIPALLAPGTMQTAKHAPRIFTMEKFLSPGLCDWLVERAKPKIARARTFDANAEGAQIEGGRNNSAAEFGFLETGIVLALIRARIAALTGLAVQAMENTQVLHYAVGQRFAPHYDFLDPAVAAYAENIARAGQRAATFLVYLSDEFDAAETSFLTLDWRWRGAKGDAILFWNVDEAGAPDRATLHAGLAPTRGEKWLLSQWIRRAP
jgi:prolyl 4-hydroxylase